MHPAWDLSSGQSIQSENPIYLLLKIHFQQLYLLYGFCLYISNLLPGITIWFAYPDSIETRRKDLRLKGRAVDSQRVHHLSRLLLNDLNNRILQSVDPDLR